MWKKKKKHQKPGLNVPPNIQMNSKWIIDVIVKYNTIKFLKNVLLFVSKLIYIVG